MSLSPELKFNKRNSSRERYSPERRGKIFSNTVSAEKQVSLKKQDTSPVRPNLNEIFGLQSMGVKEQMVSK